MAKAKKEAPKPKHNEKLKLNIDFHEAMKVLADHANDPAAKKTTYKNRRKA